MELLSCNRAACGGENSVSIRIRPPSGHGYPVPSSCTAFPARPFISATQTFGSSAARFGCARRVPDEDRRIDLDQGRPLRGWQLYGPAAAPLAVTAFAVFGMMVPGRAANRSRAISASAGRSSTLLRAYSSVMSQMIPALCYCTVEIMVIDAAEIDQSSSTSTLPQRQMAAGCGTRHSGPYEEDLDIRQQREVIVSP